MEREPIELNKLSHPTVLPPPRPYKNPTLTATLSILVPGLGHCYLDDYKTALTISGCAETGLCLGFSSNNDNILFTGNYTFITAYSYGIYAAYRDAHIYNRSSFKMPKDTFSDLATAYFRPSILKKPEVWGGFVGALVLATGISYLADKSFSIHPSLTVSKNIVTASAFLVGISEESLFRGYIQPQITELSNPTTGILLSSLLFGAAHIPNAYGFSIKDQLSYYTFGIPFITLFGAYLGWMTNKNCSLQESVAVHGWYDFTIFAIDAFASKKSKAMIQTPREFVISFSF